MPRMGWRGKRLTRHVQQCRICRHEACAQIERAFLDGASPREIEAEWKFASYRAIYRHAHARGLFLTRAEKLRGRIANTVAAATRIIEKVDSARVTGSNVLAAVRIVMKINALEEKDRLAARSQM